MKTTKPAVILLALVLLTAVQPVEAMEKPEISDTRIASCLFKITTDEAVLPLNEFAVDYLMHSSGVAGKAAREVLEIQPDVASELFEIEEIYSLYPDSGGRGGGIGGGGYGGGIGIPLLGTTVPGRSYPTTVRTPSRTPTTSTTSSSRRTTTSRTPARPTTPTRRIPTRPTTPRTTTVTQPLSSTTEQTILFRLYVDLINAEAITDKTIKPAAEEFMAALIENLRSALSGAFDQYSDKLKNQLQLADNEANRAQHELVQMQDQLRNISGSRDLSRSVILREISILRQKLQTAIMKRASDETLYEATTRRIAEEQTRRKKLVEDDPITREFKSMLDVHERRLKDTQKLYESGRASAADLENVREKIIRARIELAKRQEEVSNPPGGIVISSLNNELANLSTEMALAQQEIRSFEEQLKEAEELLREADSYELLSLKADIARQNLEETLLWQARLGRNIRSVQPPVVTVIGAE
jgi:hypothetical protein